MNEDNHFELYRQLLSRIDSKFSEIFVKNRDQFQCGRGCFGCCKSGLTVTNVEAEHISSWLGTHRDAVRAIQAALTERAFGDEFCGFLSAAGECLIYEARPTVCRSHGAPILVPGDNEELDGDVCPLNFSDFDLGTLPQTDWIRIDTLNMLLSRIDLEFSKENAGKRRTLMAIFTSALEVEAREKIDSGE